MSHVRRLAMAAVLAVLAFGAAAPVAADAPTGGLLVTTGDHLDPGAPFTVLGSRIDPGASVAFRLQSDADATDLGTAYVAQDGTLSATFDVPPDFPTGDAYVLGRTSTGATLELYVHVGQRATAPGLQPPSDGPIGDQAIGLILAGFGGVLLLVAGAWWWLGRRQEGAPPA